MTASPELNPNFIRLNSLIPHSKLNPEFLLFLQKRKKDRSQTHRVGRVLPWLQVELRLKSVGLGLKSASPLKKIFGGC